MSHEVFVSMEDQGQLLGILHLPDGEDASYPTVIYCPGKNGERYEVHRLAVKFGRLLADRGIAMLRFDYYGLGLSDGYFHEMTTSTKVSNVMKAYEYVSDHAKLDRNKIVLLGFSDGARIALLSALQAGVGRIVLWSPLFQEYWGNFPGTSVPRFTRHPQFRDKLVLPWAGHWVGMDFYKDLKLHEVDRKLNRYNGESLLLYGEEDPLYCEEREKMPPNNFSIYHGNKKNQVIGIARAGHLFNSVELERCVMAYTADWLYQTLGLERRCASETQ